MKHEKMKWQAMDSWQVGLVAGQDVERVEGRSDETPSCT